MKVVLSPAKSLDFDSQLPTGQTSECAFLEESARVNDLLKKESSSRLSQLMKISDNLAQLNYNRNQEWCLPFTKDNARPAMYTFSGDVYKGLDAYTIDTNKLGKVQETVRIISGLYGLLKPLDLIQPYRLEMGTKFPIGNHKNLYEFWKKQITEALNEELQEDELFVNLASQEYFKVIDIKALKVPVVHVKFQELKAGKYKTIAIFSKLARGLMTRYIIDSNAETIDDIKTFNQENYRYTESLSSDSELVFTR